MIIGTAATIGPGWKWIAVLIGFGVLGLLWMFVGLTNKRIGWRVWRLAQGADGVVSTSKFQWLVWLVVILFTYIVLWVLRAKSGQWGAITDVPANLLAVLGFSTGTAIAAKGITVAYLQSGRITKPNASDATSAAGGVLLDDSGYPELAKVQMVGFTFIAVGIYLATVIHQILSNPVQTNLPNLDSALLVLMGISQGGYLGKKLVSAGTPMLYPFSPPSAAHGNEVTLHGASLGPAQGSRQLLLDGHPLQAKTWTDNSITFDLATTYPGPTGAWPAQPVQIAIDLGGGQTSNQVTLTVT